jgi:hypothetical protein
VKQNPLQHQSPNGYCGAKTRNGTPCKHEPGWGTDHFGTGRCRLHGGAGGRPIVHGRYAYALQGRLREKFIASMADDNPLDLLPELAVQRTLLSDYISRFAPGIPLTAESVEFISDLTNDVVNTATKIINARNQTALTVAEVKYLQLGIMALLDEFIPDTDQRRAFVARLMAIIPAGYSATTADDGGLEIPKLQE